MANTDALRPLVATALHQSVQQHDRQEESQRTPASQQSWLTSFHTRLAAALSAPVRQALDLREEWDNWLHQPRAVFRLDTLKGSAEFALHFYGTYGLWVVQIPHPHRSPYLFDSQALEQGLLVAIGRFWKEEGMPLSAAAHQGPGGP